MRRSVPNPFRPDVPVEALHTTPAVDAFLSRAYDKTPFGIDAERVDDGYRQMGKLALEPYDEIRKAAESIDAAKPTIEGHLSRDPNW